MSMPKQTLLLCTICLIAMCVEAVSPVTVPSSVLAMLLVLALLLLRVIQPRHLEGATAAIQSYMGFFFVPTCVSILEKLDILKEYGVVIVLLCFIGTVATFAFTALITTILLKLTDKGGAQL